MKLISYLFAGLLIFGMAGCSLEGVGDSTAPTSNQRTVIESKITAFTTNFQSAVMNFDPDAMLADFDNREPTTTKILAIAEGSYTPYEKDYQTLYEELKDVVAEQSTWHTEHNYQLTLNLFQPTYQIDSGTHGTGEQRFTVQESGEGYPDAITTDTGTITWEVQSISGEWKIIKMTILYDASPRNAYAARTKFRPGAFGFGTYEWDN